MKNYLFILILLIYSCSTKVNQLDSYTVDEGIDSNSIINKNVIDTSSKISAKPAFIHYNLRKYECSKLDNYLDASYDILDTNLLTRFNLNMSKSYIDLNNSGFANDGNFYNYSKDKSIGEYSVVTVIGNPMVSEHPLILLLINKQDSIVTSITVANSYREGGGCLNSEYTNDTTLKQTFEWYEQG